MGRNLRSVFTRCDAPLPLGRKYVAVKLLTNQTLYFAVESKCTVQDIFDQLCCYLGIVDSQLFGLARFVTDAAEYCFVDQAARLEKLAPKTWKTLNSAGLDGHGRPLITLYLRVQYFVDCTIFWQDRVACHHYYHQIKANMVNYDWAMSQEKAFLLASLALQADLGNYDPVKHRGRYFEPNRYFARNIVNSVGELFIVSNLPLMHRDHHNLNRTSSQLAFIKESNEFTMHVYKVQQKKSNYDFTYLGVSAKGLQVYQPIATPVLSKPSCNIVMTKECLFPWADISKLTFDRRRFEVRLEGRCRQLLKFVYTCHSESIASALLDLCKKTHQFNLAIQPRLTELLKMEKRNRVTKYRESYIYDPDDASCGQHTPTKSFLNKSISRNSSPALSGSDPRISVISSSSSNTTSGVMSDKPQSPESEDEDSRVPVTLSMESLHSSHHNKETGGCSDYGTLENLNKKALSEHNLSYHNKLHSKDINSQMESYANGFPACLSSTDGLSSLKAVPETTALDKAISLDNIALANASLYHSKPHTDLRIAVSYVDAMKATSEEYLSGDSRPQKAKPLYQKNKPQLRGAPQPATRSTSFAGHQKPRPPPVKPRTKIGISSLNKSIETKTQSQPDMLHTAKSQPDLSKRLSTSVSIDSLVSSDVLDEVRLKSSQHNLPFMSALCQDRSLMPKTVPNMRLNPIAKNNDTRRFSCCTYLLSDSIDAQPIVSGSLFKYTSLTNVAPSMAHPPTPPRQMIPHKLSQEAATPLAAHRKAVVF